MARREAQTEEGTGRGWWAARECRARARACTRARSAAHARAAVKGLAERLEALLAGRVPDLQRHELVAHGDVLGAEVGANRRLVHV